VKFRYVWLACYIATIFAANWALKTFGFIDIGFGLMAPAGVLFAGLAFTFRDLTHEALGRWACVVAIGVGAALSYLIEDGGRIAIASGVAFGASELLDLAVYEPLRKRWLIAVTLSNICGFVLDSALFLWMAFGSLDFIEGQLLGKAYMTALAVAILFVWRKWNARERRLLSEVQG
jgi:hypothetical protein